MSKENLNLKDSLDITKQEVNSKENEMKLNEAAMKSAQDEITELKDSITRANEFNADEIKKVKEQLEKEITEKNNIQEKLEKNESERLELVKTVTELISNVNTMKAALEEEAVKQKATIKSKDEEIKQLKKSNSEKISELEDERKKAEEE